MIERFLMWVYRRLVPAAFRRRIPQDLKDRLLVSLMLVSRRDLNTIRLRRAATVASKTGDWDRAVALWQDIAVLCAAGNVQLLDGTLNRVLARRQSMPAATTDARDLDCLGEAELDAVLKGGLALFDTEGQRRLRYAQTELVRGRLGHAADLHARGKKRHFREQLCRAVEAIPDQRVFKKDLPILNGVRLYVNDALAEDGLIPRQARATPPPQESRPLKIAICLDVLKLSDVHTHARVVFAICRNLMRLDQGIETHIIITNERFVVTTPIVNASFDPGRATAILEQAREALPEYYGKRFFVHVFKSMGLSGLVDTCKGIMAVNPDVLLFGGGNKGFFSNESRVVRHCLYDHFPTAFFFIQSNNEVDDKNDIIIARGPHAILGHPGTAEVRIQPYPTINEAQIETVVQPGRRKQKIIVSAITGVRMDIKMAEQSDSDMRAFFSVLDKTPGAVWHLIGAADPAALTAANRHVARRVEKGQVVVHPVLPLADFTALVGKASLFLHLPGFTGGSGGAAVARRAGVPILTFRHSDVSGRQPRETVFDTGDTTGFVAMAIRLLHDPDLWESTVRQQFAHSRWILETSAQGFYDCLCAAHKTGAARLARNVPSSAPQALSLRPSA